MSGYKQKHQSLEIHTDTGILLKHRLIAVSLSAQTEQLGPTAFCLNSVFSLHGYIHLGLGPTVHFVAAVLAAGAPQQTAFMSDEAMESVPGLKPFQYTAKHYALYLDKMVERTQKLNKGEIIKGKVITSAAVHFWY